VKSEFIILNSRPLLSFPIFFLKLKILGLGVRFLHGFSGGNFNILELLFSDTVVFNELTTEDFSNRLDLADNLVHEGLGEGGLIEFVVTEFTVADQVNNNVLHELLTELGSELEGTLNVFHRVGVNVENRRIDTLGNIRCILTRPSFNGDSSETDLVVHDNVDGASNSVVGK